MSRSAATQAMSADRAIPAMARSLRHFLRNRGDGIGGVAAIEFAVIAMLLVVMTIGTVDFGMGFYRKMQVYNAAQAGARYAMIHGFNEAKISQAITSATRFTSISVVKQEHFCGCPSATDVTRVSAPPPCSLECPDGSTAGAYVTAAAQATYETILRYPALIPDSFTFQSQSTVRVR